jgi:hypothetical protein
MARTPKSAPPAPVVYTNKQILEAATGKWGEIAHDIKPAEPFPVQVPDSDKVITVMPLTRRRRKAIKASQATYLMMGAQLAEVAKEGNPDQGVISRIQGLIDEAEEAYDRAMFGDAYDELVELFEDVQEEFWDAMYQGVHDQIINRVELPEDVCSKCGQEIETDDEDDEDGEAKAGKDASSSTSATVTSLKSKGTSGTTSA